MIHHIKKPFLCRVGQFSQTRDLCASISVKVLEKNKTHKIRLGINTIHEYTFDCTDVLAKSKGKIYKKGNKEMIIVPLELWCIKKETIKE